MTTDYLESITWGATAEVTAREYERPGPRTQADIDRLPPDYVATYANQRMGQVVGSNAYRPRPRSFWERIKGRFL